MTYRELYLTAKQKLYAAGVDSPEHDAAALLLHFFDLDRPALALRGELSPERNREEHFLRAVEERAARRPLQYILGEWEFMELTLAVGEGVLVPREDTAVLVEALAQRLSFAPSPRGLDLCAGTGAVALGLCSLLPSANILCIELSAGAFSFLERNIAAYPELSVASLCADVLSPRTAARFLPETFDFIASNPPYIATEEIRTLQPEVQKEPSLALDGGKDGLLFYRAIAELWLPLLKKGGVLGVEIGDTQADEVLRLFSSHGLKSISVCKDWAGLDRAVVGEKR